MFDAEPLEKWSKEEAAEFEAHFVACQKKLIRRAVWAGAAFLLNVLCIVPFLDGYPLHRYWETARNLFVVAMVLLVWVVIRAALVWASWQSARETRREFSN